MKMYHIIQYWIFNCALTFHLFLHSDLLRYLMYSLISAWLQLWFRPHFCVWVNRLRTARSEKNRHILFSGCSIKQPERNCTKPKYSLWVNSNENNDNNISHQHIAIGLYYKYEWRFQILPSMLDECHLNRIEFNTETMLVMYDFRTAS